LKKLLYITVNSKPEEVSSSKIVGRAFVNKLKEKHSEFAVEELDLYDVHIPRLEYQYFESRNAIVSKEAYDKLSENEKGEVDTIKRLCDQFISADVYVIVAPMWSLSFPAPLKEYIDAVIQVGKTITFEGDKPQGLMNDKARAVVYIQSSGGNIPWLMKPVLNKGLNYVEDIMKFIGIKRFEQLLVDGTGYTEEERHKAIEKAKNRIDEVIGELRL
jgi:FMN-dependent NADH-azoreductase